jgi:O-antigen ligase
VSRAPVSQAAAAPPMSADITDVYKWPWQGVRWSLGYICFLFYCAGITTYIADFGTPSMVIALLALSIGAGGDRWRLPPYMALLAAFFVLAALGYKMTEYAEYTWTALTDLMKVMIVGAVGVAVLTSRARIRFFVFALLGMYGLYPVRGAIFNFFLYNSTTQGRVAWNHVFANPNDFATLMLLPIGLALGVLMTEKQKWLRLAAFAGLAVMPVAVMLTQSRGGILAMGVSGIVVVVGFKKQRMRVLLATAVVAAGVVMFSPSSVWKRLSDIESAAGSGNLKAADDQNSAAQRFELWKVAIKVAKNFPITGVGWGAYPNANAEFGRQSQFTALTKGARDSHNTYLTLLAETGVIGISMWLGAIAVLVGYARHAVRAMRPLLPGYAMQLKFMVIALMGFGVAGVFGSYAHWSYTYVHFAIIYAMAAQGLRDVQQLRGAPRRGA